MSPKEILFEVVKCVASIVMAAYGLYATFTDLRVEKHGRKVLSRKGYVGVGLLIVGVVLSIGADWWKDRDEASEHRSDEQRQSKLLSQEQQALSRLDDQVQKTSDIANGLGEQQRLSKENIRATQSVFNQTQRALEPIKGFSADFRLRIPRDQPEVDAYVRGLNEHIMRIFKDGTPALNTPSYSVGQMGSDVPVDIRIKPGSPLLPDRQQQPRVRQTLEVAVLELDFYREAARAEAFLRGRIIGSPQPDLRVILPSWLDVPPDSPDGLLVDFDLTKGELYLDASAKPAPDSSLWKANGKIVSVSDLLRSHMIMRPQLEGLAFPSAQQGVALVSLSLGMGNGRQFHLDLAKAQLHKIGGNPPAYTCDFAQAFH